MPKLIVPNNTKALQLEQFRDSCFWQGITHITTTLYYSQICPVNRVNRNLKAVLKIFHHQSQNFWDEDLPWLIKTFNTAVHDSTKNTQDNLFWAWNWCLSCKLLGFKPTKYGWDQKKSAFFLGNRPMRIQYKLLLRLHHATI